MAHSNLVSALVNGASSESLFAENPHGWVKVMVCLPDGGIGTLEEQFIKEARQRYPALPIGKVNEIQLIGSSSGDLEEPGFVLGEDLF